jgi:hypothetical protein
VQRPQQKSTSSVKKIGNTIYANIVEHVGLDERIHVVVGFIQKMDEKKILDIFRKLQKINKFGMPKSSTIHDVNFNKSLELYNEAMSESSRLFKFRNMFNALEFVVNIDGKDRKGNDFDSEAKRLDPANCIDVQRWREFYNRIKHVHRNSSDIQAYEKGAQHLSDYLKSSRNCVQELLLSNLK